MVLAKVKYSGSDFIDVFNSLLVYPQPPPLLEQLVKPVPSLEMGRVASGRASGVKFLPQHSSFEYRWII
jgi:hypothetical protein